jgi:hypothetical protein
VGSHSITAQYAGSTANLPSTSLALPFSVNNGSPPDFALTSSIVTGVTMSAGQSSTLPLTLTGSSGFSGTVTITCVGLPQGAACVSTPATVTLVGTTPQNVSILLTTTGPNNGSVAPTSRLRKAAIPLFGLAALFAFMRRRRWRVATVAGVLALCILSACGGGGGGGSALPGLAGGANGSGTGGSGSGSGSGTGGTGPGASATPTPTPGGGGSNGTDPASDGQPPTISAGTGLPGIISTSLNPNGPVFPATITPGTIVPGALAPGTSSAPAGQTPGGTSTVALVATGSNGIAHPLNITVSITP